MEMMVQVSRREQH